MRLNVQKLRLHHGWTQEELAEVSGLSRSYIAAIENQKIDKSPSMEASVRLANALKVRIGELFDDARHVTIAGKVGAGAKVPLVDDFAKGDGLYHVVCPFELSSGTNIVGVEVEGDSMTPIYRDGDVLFYSRHTVGVPTEAISAICVCEDTGGDVWVKHVKPGTEPGKFHLISLNPLVDNMFDVTLRWAAPVKLAWPSALVEKI